MAEPPVKMDLVMKFALIPIFRNELPLLDDCRYICHLFLV